MRTSSTRTSTPTNITSGRPRPAPWHTARPGLEKALRIDPLGRDGPTRGQVRSGRWRAVAPGWFRPAGGPATVEQRIVEASYRAPADGGVTGWAALRWLGGRWFEGAAADGAPLPVPVTMLGACRSSTPGVVHTKERLTPAELVTVDDLRITTAVRSVLFEMRHAPTLLSALTHLDMACYNDLVSVAEVTAWLEANKGWTGIQQARDAVALADENAWSPAEVAMRWLWTRIGGLGPVLCNVPVFDLHGRFLFTTDLLDPVVGVVGEHQGPHHFERDQRRRDITRETLMRDLGLEYVERVAGEDPTRFLIRLRSAYARAARQPADVRQWTLEPPKDWVPTNTVEQRRALTPHQQRALLAHRQMSRAA